MARKLSEALNEQGGMNVDPSLIQACLAEYTEVDTQIKRLSQKQAAMFKRYENQGVNVRSIKNSHRASRQDKAAAAAQAQSDVRYLIITGVLNPANDDWAKHVSQTDMFSQEASATSPIGTVSPQLARARAHSDGYNTGRHGGDGQTNPHTAGSAEHVAWLGGLKDGQADRALRPGAARVVKANDAAPRKRGRPNASEGATPPAAA